MSRTATHRPRVELRLAVIGCGRVFERYHLPALRRSDDWKLVAACDASSVRRDWVRDQCREAAVRGSLADCLEAAQADAVLVATPPDSHAPLAIEALQRGLHVLVEKPMALNEVEARMVWQVARQTRRRLWVGFNRRFCRPYRDLRDRLAAVRPERLRGIRCDFSSGTPGGRSASPHLGDEARGGGILEDIACHQIDLLPWLIGRPVIEARLEYGAAGRCGTRAAQFEVRFSDGLVARCRAVHDPAFRESIAVELDDRALWADRLGMFENRRLPLKRVRVYSELRTIIASLARRLQRGRSEVIMSFERQLHAFAREIVGEPAGLLAADAAAGARAMEIIRACRESLNNGGRWSPVVSIGEPPA